MTPSLLADPPGAFARLAGELDLDRQSIERRDFPIGRRGYDPAAVDAHLRVLASAIEELRQSVAERGPDTLAATAGSQVQAIVAAAEVAAAEIESEAKADAERMRAQAKADAEQTRADAIAKAQVHVAAVGRATANLLARVESLDGETGALVDSLRAGATRLAGDLVAVETNMGELYDAAAGRTATTDTVSAIAAERPEPYVPPTPDDVPAPPVAASSSTTSTVAAGLPGEAQLQARVSSGLPESPAEQTQPLPAPFGQDHLADQPAGVNGDSEGARLVALNMALNGDSREETDRYIAENYEVEDRAKLLDEVYAAIES
jgi:hypothetical protein